MDAPLKTGDEIIVLDHYRARLIAIVGKGAVVEWEHGERSVVRLTEIRKAEASGVEA